MIIMARIQFFYEQVILEMGALPASSLKMLQATHYQLGLRVYEHLPPNTDFTIGYIPLAGRTTSSVQLLQAEYPKLRVVPVTQKELIEKKGT